MMQYDEVSLYGIKIGTLRRGCIADHLQERGIFFIYNYFEDAFWEDAGFRTKNGTVISEKVGWSCFADTVYAAYLLEGLYSEAPIIPLYNGACCPFAARCQYAMPVCKKQMPVETRDMHSVSCWLNHRVSLTGEVSNPINSPEGCKFCERCPYAAKQCRKEMPPLLERKPGHFAACWR